MLTSAQPLVSIVIPSYNGLPYLEEAIESILKQTYKNIELIVLDDGSSDSTIEFMQKYKNKLHFESHKNIGQSETLNKGWYMSKGEILAYLSADDILLPAAVEQAVYCFLHEPDVVLCYGDNQLVDKNSKIIKPLITKACSKLVLYEDCSTPVAVGSFFLKTVFDKIGGWDNQYKQIADYEYHLRLIEIGKFKKIDRMVGFHRVHEASASFRPMTFERAEEWKKLMNERLTILEDPNVLINKNKILARAILVSGRAHYRSNRKIIGLQYFLKAIYLYPKSLLSKSTYKMMLNALLSKSYYEWRLKFQNLFSK